MKCIRDRTLYSGSQPPYFGDRFVTCVSAPTHALCDCMIPKPFRGPAWRLARLEAERGLMQSSQPWVPWICSSGDIMSRATLQRATCATEMCLNCIRTGRTGYAKTAHSDSPFITRVGVMRVNLQPQMSLTPDTYLSRTRCIYTMIAINYL